MSPYTKIKKVRPTAKARASLAAKGGSQKANVKALALCKFDSLLITLVNTYVQLITDSRPWRWNDVKPPGGERLTETQRSKIREYARKNGLVDVVPLDVKQNHVKLPPGAPPFVKFPSKYVADVQILPSNMWEVTDPVQFTWLNNNLASRNPDYDPKTQTFKSDPKKKKYTWHHDQHPPGQMQLLEFGIHNATNHSGGRNVWGGGSDSRS